jgi:hypothetical protein
MKSKIVSLAAVAILLMMTEKAQAILIDLDRNLIYDSAQNITWYDFAFNPGFDDWAFTDNWVNNLTYLDFTDWRSPTIEELQFLGRNEFRSTGTYSTDPFESVGAGLEFYLSSTLSGVDQRLVYSPRQDRTFGTSPPTSVFGVAVRDGNTAVSVPEPATAVLLGAGIVGFALTKFRRRGRPI